MFDFKFLEDGMLLNTSATTFLTSSFSNLSANLSANMSFSNLSISISSSHNSNSNGQSSRTRSRSNPTDLCIESFRDFVALTLSDLVEDDDLLTMVQSGIEAYVEYAEATAVQDNGNDTRRPPYSALNEIELGLLSILEASRSLPSSVVADLHSYLGLVFQKAGDAAAAKESFLRSLWIRTHMMRAAAAKAEEDEDEATNHQDLLLDIALTEHRLGIAIGRSSTSSSSSGHFTKAIQQIERAIHFYEQANVGISEGCYASAREDLHEFQEEYQLSLLAKSRVTSPIPRRSLRRCVTVSGASFKRSPPTTTSKSYRTFNNLRRQSSLSGTSSISITKATTVI